MKQVTITEVQVDVPGAGQITIVGTYAEVAMTQPAQQVTVGEFPAGNLKWSRGHSLTNSGLLVKRNTTSGVKAAGFDLESLGLVAIALVPELTYPPVFSLQPVAASISSGGSGSMTATAAAETSVSYQWQYESKATNTLNVSGNFNDGDEVEINDTVYTFKTSLSPAEGEVLIGADAEASLNNLYQAINRLDPGENQGVIYQVAAAHATFEARSNTATTMPIRSKLSGSEWNGVGCSTSAGTAFWTETETVDGGNWASATGVVDGCSFTDDTTATLAIQPVTTNITGTQMRVVASNGSGDTNSSEATLTVT